MFLTSGTLGAYLINRGTLDPQHVVDGTFQVVEAGRRNRNYKVLTGPDSGMFIKQVSLMAEELQSTVRREALLYELVATRPAFQALKPMTVNMLDYDAIRGVLTTDLICDGMPLGDYFAHFGAEHAAIGAQLGTYFADVHQANPQILADTDAIVHMPHRQPWILHMPQHAEQIMPNMTPGQIQVVEHIRANPLLTGLLADVAGQWRQTSLVHGDLKWDNIVVTLSKASEETDAQSQAQAQAQAPTPLGMKIVDWELADIGDAGWDIGCVIAGYLQRTAFFHVAQSGHVAPQPGQDTVDFAKMFHAEVDGASAGIHAFWAAYAQPFDLLNGPYAPAGRYRAIQFAAVRLVLSAFEMAITAGPEDANIAALLQWATAIAIDPNMAATNVLGAASDVAQADQSRDQGDKK